MKDEADVLASERLGLMEQITELASEIADDRRRVVEQTAIAEADCPEWYGEKLCREKRTHAATFARQAQERVTKHEILIRLRKDWLRSIERRLRRQRSAASA